MCGSKIAHSLWPAHLYLAHPQSHPALPCVTTASNCPCPPHRPDLPALDSRDALGPAHLTYFADVDTLTAYPSLKACLARTLIYGGLEPPCFLSTDALCSLRVSASEQALLAATPGTPHELGRSSAGSLRSTPRKAKGQQVLGPAAGLGTPTRRLTESLTARWTGDEDGGRVPDGVRRGGSQMAALLQVKQLEANFRVQLTQEEPPEIATF